MLLNLNSEPITRGKNNTILDSTTKTVLKLTPSELTRQQMISYLKNKLGYPLSSLYSATPENGLEGKTERVLFVNIQRDENLTECAAVIVCLGCRTSILDSDLYFARGICDNENALFYFVCNGEECVGYKFNAKNLKYYPVDSIPLYSKLESDSSPRDYTFEDIPAIVKENRQFFDAADTIGYGSPDEIAEAAFNIRYAIFDPAPIACNKYELFEIIEDLGIQNRSYGNAAGGKFDGSCRCLKIKDYTNSIYEVSLNTHVYWTDRNPEHKTALCIGIDKPGYHHHALQLIMDSYVEITGNRVEFNHNGNYAVGRIGSGKISVLMDLVKEKSRGIVWDGKKRFHLGNLTNDRLWNINDPEISNLIANLITYSILRDEAREITKAERSREQQNENRK